MEEFKIGSFNLKNHYLDRNWNGGTFPKDLAQFIRQQNINYLGVQELTRKYSKALQKNLRSNYKIFGEYRYGHLPLIEQFNESNAIITNQPVTNTETKYLAKYPFFSYLTQNSRIMTSIETEDCFMINTHLEYWTKTSQIHQLKVLYNYILAHLSKNLIITGDFNMDDYNKPYFIEFIKQLEKIGIIHVENRTPTYKTKEQVLDHIFIDKSFEIQDYSVIQNHPINSISDHCPILVKVKKK